MRDANNIRKELQLERVSNELFCAKCGALEDEDGISGFRCSCNKIGITRDQFDQALEDAKQKYESIKRSEEVTKENEKANLISALIKAQSDFKKIDRNTKAYNYNYAPLEVVREATLPSLLKNGLTIIQFPISKMVMGESMTQEIGVKTILAHESGDKIEESFTIVTTERNPQKLGSLITYFRRYGWLAVLGVAPEDEDDDAQSVSNNNQNRQQSNNNQSARMPSEKQKKFYFQLLNTVHSNAIPPELIESAKKMNSQEMSKAIDELNKQVNS